MSVGVVKILERFEGPQPDKVLTRLGQSGQVFEKSLRQRNRRFAIGWVVVPISIAVDVKKHAANDLGSSRLEKSIELVDAGDEGVIKIDHELLIIIKKNQKYYNKSEKSVRQFITK